MDFLLWVALLVGVLTWPQMTLCVLLFWHGYPVLGVVCLLTSFYSGKDFAHAKLTAKKD